jgi:hypothetical protein
MSVVRPVFLCAPVHVKTITSPSYQKKSPWLQNADFAIHHLLKTIRGVVTGCCLDGIVLDACVDIKMSNSDKHAGIIHSV